MTDPFDRDGSPRASVSRASIDRRRLLKIGTAGTAALGLGGAFRPWAARAQDGSPAASPAATGLGTEPGTRSITHAEAIQQIKDAYGITDAPAQGGRVIVPTFSDLQTLNGILTADATSALVADLVYEGLLSGNPATGELVPGVAEYWELAEDGITYTFYLNQNIRWHDGQPFTANDVVFSFDSVLNPEINSDYRSSVAAVTDTYRAVDDHTFEIKAKDRFVTFLGDSPGTVRLIPRHIWENVPPDQWPNDPGSTGEDPSRVVGTGPFKFQSRALGDSITLVRNDEYWDEVPNIDDFLIRIVPDTEAEIAALQAGDVDIIETVSFARVEELGNTPGLQVETYPTGTFWYYIYNLDPAITPLFQDQRVRQALFYAIDRQAIVDNITFGFAEVAQGTQPKISIAYAPDRIETQYTYDPDRARQLLDEAGWTPGADGIREREGQRLEIEWLTVAGVGEYETMLQAIQEWWRDVGVAMTPTPIDFPTLLDRQESHDFQIMNLAFNWTPPTWDQGPMFRTDSYEGGFNYAKYSNPEFDRLDDEQRLEQDVERRIDLLIQQSNIVNEDLPVGILLFRDQRVAYSDRLGNYHATTRFPSHLWSLPWVYVQE